MKERDLPLDELANAIRETGKDVQSEFQRAAAHSEKVQGIFCMFVYSEPLPDGVGPTRVHISGIDEEIVASLLTCLDDDFEVDFAEVARRQQEND